VNVREEQSYPMQATQMVKSAEEKAASKATAEANKVKKTAEPKKPGRPKGSKNKRPQAVVLKPELLRIQEALHTLLATVDTTIPLKYVVMDGHFGNYPSAFMVRQANLHLISKLRTDIYQGQFYNKEFAFLLNVVVILKTNLETQAQAHVILFSTDLEQAYTKIIKFYSLRFQIEFNFRDAKQYWGLEDFMNVKETAVTNAANLSLFMVNFSAALLQSFRQQNPEYSILDLKSPYRGYRYATETIKMLPQKPDAILLADIFQQLARLGAIHPLLQPSASP